MRLTDLVRTVDQYESLVDKLEANSIPEPNTGCHLWLGGCTDGGHGMVRTAIGVIGAHVLSYLLHVDHIPNGLVVRHSCDQPSCINADHLTPGTQLQNMADKVARGRQARKLSDADILHIRAVYRKGARPSLADLGAQFGVSGVAIFKVLRAG